MEDESPFQTVRRLAEYEDYALHLVREAGVRTARPYGIVEITPEREYLLVTEFFKGAVEIGQALVDDAVIGQGLAMIRKLWDAGIAHRDIKPGNLMVRSGELVLIDVCFAQVRPSPWRQAAPRSCAVTGLRPVLGDIPGSGLPSRRGGAELRRLGGQVLSGPG